MSDEWSSYRARDRTVYTVTDEDDSLTEAERAEIREWFQSAPRPQCAAVKDGVRCITILSAYSAHGDHCEACHRRIMNEIFDADAEQLAELIANHNDDDAPLDLPNACAEFQEARELAMADIAYDAIMNAAARYRGDFTSRMLANLCRMEPVRVRAAIRRGLSEGRIVVSENGRKPGDHKSQRYRLVKEP